MGSLVIDVLLEYQNRLDALASEQSRSRTGRERLRTSRLCRFYERSIQRIAGEWPGAGSTGNAFRTASHRYADDLNIFGEGSLFELLCTARTAVGECGLADYLTDSVPLDESISRQEAVRELQGRTDLRERVATLGRYDYLQSKWDTFETWLDSERAFPSRSLRICLAITTVVLAFFLLAGATGLLVWNTVALFIAPLLVFHSIVGLRYRDRINRMQAWLWPVSAETQLLTDGLHLLNSEPFESPKLKALSKQIQGAANGLAKLGRILHALSERQKDWFYLPGLLFVAGTQLSLAAEDWRQRHTEDLRNWLSAWAEFEALNCLGGYAFENPDNTFPDFTTSASCFQARALEHPLIHRGTAVPNAITLDNTTQWAMISGSNMSGKSTLLRAVGLNAVLAFAGAPVRAASLTLSQLEIYASLSLTDSLLNGVSKFRAEVDRLQETLASAGQGTRVLFLIDEIFSGTNSRDRRIAAEAVIRTLLDRGAIGALSTHDLSLCEIPSDPELHGVNLHLGSRENGDPLDFDYKLKPGITTESNALAIARLAGVPI